jgi:hypothetical protein
VILHERPHAAGGDPRRRADPDDARDAPRVDPVDWTATVDRSVEGLGSADDELGRAR